MNVDICDCWRVRLIVYVFVGPFVRWRICFGVVVRWLVRLLEYLFVGLFVGIVCLIACLCVFECVSGYLVYLLIGLCVW